MELREVFEPLVNFLRNLQKKDKDTSSKDKAKERLQLVLLQDRASVSPDFFEMMKKEIIDVIKKYIEIDEEALEVQLTRGFEEGDGTGPALYANIPIKNIKPVAKKIEEKEDEELITEVIENTDIIQECEKEESLNKNDNVDNFDVQNADEPDMEINVQEPEKTEQVENSETEGESLKIEETVKEKIAEVKDGVVETIEKVKKGAKEGIKKIKTKSQKNKINE